MPDLSLTDLVDVIASSGTPKMTKVRQIKHRATYNPATDFYRPFRDEVIEIHRKVLGRTQLSQVTCKLTDRKKVANYPDLVNGYLKWWGKKTLAWFTPPAEVWSAHGVHVRVNPELGLVVNGTN